MQWYRGLVVWLIKTFWCLQDREIMVVMDLLLQGICVTGGPWLQWRCWPMKIN